MTIHDRVCAKPTFIGNFRKSKNGNMTQIMAHTVHGTVVVGYKQYGCSASRDRSRYYVTFTIINDEFIEGERYETALLAKEALFTQWAIEK